MSDVYLALTFHLFSMSVNTYVCSGAVYDLCYAIKSDEGFFTPAQLEMFNTASGHSLGATEIRSYTYFRTGMIYLVTTPNGGIPCDPEEKLRRSYEAIPPKYND